MRTITYQDLDERQRRLLDAAEDTMKTAYNPYSHFYVGAALLTRDDKIITGSNVENAAYGSTICAERSALVRANAMGEKVYRSLAVISRGGDFKTESPSAPCGNCRQMIYEASQVSGEDIEIIISNTDKTQIIIATISELLPLAFGPKDVGVKVEDYR